MTIGLSLLSALLVEGAHQRMRLLRDDHFTSDERAAWTFLRDYYQRHGGLPTVAVMAESGYQLTPATGNFNYHLDRVGRRMVYNTIQGNHQPLLDALNTRDMDAAVEALNVMQLEVSRVRASQSVSDMRDWSRMVREAYDAGVASGHDDVVTLGWAELNRITHGGRAGDVIAVVGRPGDGKTYTAVHMALAAWRQGRRVLFVTMEMTDMQVARRLIGLHAGFDPAMITEGRVSHFGRPVFHAALAQFDTEEGGNFFLVGGGNRDSLREVDSLVQDLRPDIVYIDASYLMRPPPGGKRQSRWEMLADVAEGLKAMALARNLPIVHTVQFNREARKRRNADHDLAMIGGTDAVGQVASIVIAIRAGPPNNEMTQRQYHVMKNRDGPPGKFRTRWMFNPVDFSEIPDDREQRDAQQQQSMAQLNEDML